MINARPRIMVLLSTAALFAACSDSTAPSAALHPVASVATDSVIQVHACIGPATSLSAAQMAIVPLIPSHDIDDTWAEIAQTIPGGFAGVIYDTTTGKPTILLTDTTQGAAAKAALAPLLVPINRFFDTDAAVIRRARWNAAQLRDWYRYLTTASILDGHPIWFETNMTSNDIDEASNRISISTQDAASQSALASRLERLDLPCDLVLVEVLPPAMALD